MAKGKKSKGDHKVSSGKHKLAVKNRAVRKLRQKIARWERYKEKGKPAITAAQEEKKNKPNKSRHHNWDTTGLKKHLELLEALL